MRLEQNREISPRSRCKPQPITAAAAAETTPHDQRQKILQEFRPGKQLDNCERGKLATRSAPQSRKPQRKGKQKANPQTEISKPTPNHHQRPRRLTPIPTEPATVFTRNRFPYSPPRETHDARHDDDHRPDDQPQPAAGNEGRTMPNRSPQPQPVRDQPDRSRSRTTQTPQPNREPPSHV